MTENEKQKEGDDLMTCFVMHVSLLSLHIFQFLRNIKKYRENGRPIIYTDETFVHSTHTVSKSWQSPEVSLQAPFCRGERLIVLHAGSKAGFLKRTELVWKA